MREVFIKDVDHNQYRNNYDRIFGKKSQDNKEIKEVEKQENKKYIKISN